MASGTFKKHEYRKLLWSNPHEKYWNPDNDGDIILSSDSYDYLDFEIRLTSDNTLGATYVKRVGNIPSNGIFMLSIIGVDANTVTDNFFMGRKYTKVSNTRFSVSKGMIVRWGSTTIAKNDYFATPVRIYGIKYS